MNKEQTEGIILKASKIWWIKINTKVVRTSASDGATFPYIIKIKYKANHEYHIKNKFVYWPNEKINTLDKVIVTYNKAKPSKILKVNKILTNH